MIYCAPKNSSKQEIYLETKESMLERMAQEKIIVIIDVKESQLLTNETARGEKNNLAII